VQRLQVRQNQQEARGGSQSAAAGRQTGGMAEAERWRGRAVHVRSMAAAAGMTGYLEMVNVEDEMRPVVAESRGRKVRAGVRQVCCGGGRSGGMCRCCRQVACHRSPRQCAAGSSR